MAVRDVVSFNEDEITDEKLEEKAAAVLDVIESIRKHERPDEMRHSRAFGQKEDACPSHAQHPIVSGNAGGIRGAMSAAMQTEACGLVESPPSNSEKAKPTQPRFAIVRVRDSPS
jgi:hypothetical protein